MADVEEVDRIEFLYDHTDYDREDIYFSVVAGNKKLQILAYDWEDDIPTYAVLYDKVVKGEEYTLVIERDFISFHEYAITNLPDGKVSLRIDINTVKAYCVFKRDALLKMLRKPLLKAAKDKEYLKLRFDPEYYDIKNNPDDRKEYNAYLAMLKKQVVPEFVWKDIERYNLANPDNVFNI